jgi:hypothetical protein
MNADRMQEVVEDLLRTSAALHGQEEKAKELARTIVSRLRPPDRKVVISIESPYRPPEELLGTGEWLVILRRNVNYARALYRYALLKGYAPFASHLNYPQPGVLDDEDKAERWLGIDSGKAIERAASEQSWFGVDYGMTEGMDYGEKDAKEYGRSIRMVDLGPDWETKWLAGTRMRPI